MSEDRKSEYMDGMLKEEKTDTVRVVQLSSYTGWKRVMRLTWGVKGQTKSLLPDWTKVNVMMGQIKEEERKICRNGFSVLEIWELAFCVWIAKFSP